MRGVPALTLLCREQSAEWAGTAGVVNGKSMLPRASECDGEVEDAQSLSTGRQSCIAVCHDLGAPSKSGSVVTHYELRKVGAYHRKPSRRRTCCSRLACGGATEGIVGLPTNPSAFLLTFEAPALGSVRGVEELNV